MHQKFADSGGKQCKRLPEAAKSSAGRWQERGGGWGVGGGAPTGHVVQRIVQALVAASGGRGGVPHRHQLVTSRRQGHRRARQADQVGLHTGAGAMGRRAAALRASGDCQTARSQQRPQVSGRPMLSGGQHVAQHAHKHHRSPERGTHLCARLAEQPQLAATGRNRAEGATGSAALCLLVLCRRGRCNRGQAPTEAPGWP